MSGPLFQIPTMFQACVTSTWVSQCWVHCTQYGIDITTDIPDLKPHRECDKEIMRCFAESGYRGADLALLNSCHMNLHVIFLSDICDGSGSRIEQQFWSKGQPADIYPYNWPLPANLSTSDWNFWRRSLQLSLNLSQQQQLPVPLGCWYQEEPRTKGWYTDRTGEHLYCLVKSEWTTFVPIPARQRRRTFHDIPRPMAPDDIPDYLEKATVYSCGLRITLTGSGPIDSQKEDYSPSTEEIFASLQCEYSTQGNVQAFKKAIIQGVAVAISDRSCQSERGAVAWTIEG